MKMLLLFAVVWLGVTGGSILEVGKDIENTRRVEYQSDQIANYENAAKYEDDAKYDDARDGRSDLILP